MASSCASIAIVASQPLGVNAYRMATLTPRPESSQPEGRSQPVPHRLSLHSPPKTGRRPETPRRAFHGTLNRSDRHRQARPNRSPTDPGHLVNSWGLVGRTARLRVCPDDADLTQPHGCRRDDPSSLLAHSWPLAAESQPGPVEAQWTSDGERYRRCSAGFPSRRSPLARCDYFKNGVHRPRAHGPCWRRCRTG